MAKKKFFYAYNLTKEGISGVKDNWDEVKDLIHGKSATYKKFKTFDEAEEWLSLGATYDKVPQIKAKELHEDAIYSDSGTGRDGSVEVKVTNYKGESLLDNQEYELTQYETINLGEDLTNNFGELYGLYLALTLNKKNNYQYKYLYLDSNLILEYWSKGTYKGKNEDTAELVRVVTELRKEAEKHDVKILKISGDYNPADLGFHKL